MKPCMSALKQIQPLLSFQGPAGITMVDVPFFRRKDRVVFVMGATGTGKSRLAIDLATRFPAEIVNSDKIQVYKGLDVVTNKVTPEESRGVPHHLLGTVDPDADFTAADFAREATRAVQSIVERDRVPIIAGGSNSYIDALVNDCVDFRLRYQCCFLWVDVSRPVLHSFVSERVDKMVEIGLVDEVRRIFDPSADYSVGIRRAIGVPELDEFLLSELQESTDENRARLLETAIGKIKENTCSLACRQVQKIQRLYKQWKWNMHRIDATEVVLRRGEEADEAWETIVARPSSLIVEQFLRYSEERRRLDSTEILLPEIAAMPPLPAVAAVSR
ncbi:PREDICTED: adenylate isopentenyltransferase 5, chloroplastic-like [Tarenaya hassleriana]|uniref:adenylate isopentenyltransferase 5, chloroplastic-like n=1 Tax=Tarenaya hassleriana TaxID=28532 RepID=UPI00053C24D3|nr:PREDICTED: adenylate isopentenyltransferase 5, chloroplastic-like [Tarenaya hassleriana]